MRTKTVKLFIMPVFTVLLHFLISVPVYAQSNDDLVDFEIRGFTIEGNTLLTENILMDILKPFTGNKKSASDVEKARVALESFYHRGGYPAVQVEVPQQTVEEGLVRLNVTESRIREVKVTGNRYFTRESIIKRLPALSSGNIIYLPRLIDEFAIANRNPDMKISPVMIPGRERGTIDIELKVADKLPLHGSLEINNRSSHSTENLRVNGALRYDNLWQKEHSVSIQYQTSPEDTSQVKMFAHSYVFSAPWNDMHMIALYGVWSDSDTAFGEALKIIGKGSIYGARYIVPLPSLQNLFHNITIGMDYKDFSEDVNFTDGEQEGLKTPIKYMPLLFSYSATSSDKRGRTQYSLGLNMSFRNLVADQREFEIKRFRARGNYLYVTAGIERFHRLPWEMQAYLKLDGQVATQPLISNEQYIAGGMESVRGYKESELTGDHALHGTFELHFAELPGVLGIKSPLNARLYYFFDIAELWKKGPLPGEEKRMGIRGAGWGVKGTIYENIEYGFEWAMALDDTDNVKRRDDRVHFRLKYGF